MSVTPLARACVRLVAAALVAVGLITIAPAPSAQAAPPALVFPTGGETVEETPVLRWQRLPDVAKYDVQVADNPDFTSPLASTTTANTNYAPQVPLPEGDLWWRVRVNGSGATGWASETFARAALSTPTVLGPTGVLVQPTDPPIVRWTSVQGAKSYVLQISSDETFSDNNLIQTFETSTTSGAVPTLQVPNTYFTRVLADFGHDVLSGWSAPVGTYTIDGLRFPELVSPAMDAEVTDVVLDWKPVEGAATYDIQVDDNPSFEDSVVEETSLKGTRFSPPKTVANDSYWWRVRPVDAAGNFRGWDEMPIWTFTRVWRAQPQLEYPPNNLTVTDDLYYQWTPSKRTGTTQEDLSLASTYTLELSSTASFNEEDIIDRCDTALTTFVPGHNTPGQGVSDCFPGVAGRYYWRVIAHDEFSSARPSNEPASRQVRSFIYQPDRVHPISPVGDVLVTVPTLTWESKAGAARYRVTMTNQSNGDTETATTAATSYTPHDTLSAGRWAWQVQSVSVDGRLGVAYISGVPTFRVADQPPGSGSAPNPIGTPAGKRFPTLRWQAVADATRYSVWAKASASPGYQLVDDDFSYPAAEDSGSRFLEPGDYDFFVQAFDEDGALIANGAVGHFTIDPLDSVPSDEEWAALTGTLLPDNPADPDADIERDTCSTQVHGSGAQSDCANIRQTPVINWPSTPDTGYYNLYVAYDKAMSNPVYDTNHDGVFKPITVAQPMWTPPEALADSTALTAYYYLVVPCTFATCEALRPAENSFDKLSRGVELKAPQMGRQSSPFYTQVACPTTTDPDYPGAPECLDDVTLSWQDFRISQEADDPGNPLVAHSRTEAQSYRVQTATDPNFNDVIETVRVDQTTFTSFDETYPEGPVWWRVQAVDGSDNGLSWSEPAMFLKRSPVPLLSSPVEGDSLPGDVYFSWQPRRFAAQYDIELYRDDPTHTASPALRVASARVRQRVASLTKPLPVDDVAYTWRVRRVDARNRTGGWSAWGSFTVTPRAPALDSPAQGALDVAPSDAVFSWGPVSRAATYRFERLAPGSTTVVESVTTSSLAWAPTTAIPGGQWDWRVTALDADAKPLGTSQVRRFTVTDRVFETTPVSISGSGRVGTNLTLTPPNWNFTDDVTTTYQWYRGTGAIAGATDDTYTVTSADIGKQLSVRATGTRPGYASGTSTSNTVVGVAGDAPVALTAVAVSGTGKVGTTLTSTAPVWDDAAVATTYQWQRDAANISGATGPTYAVTSTDVGKSLTLVATGSRAGYAPGSSTSNAVLGALGDPPAATTPVAISGPNNKVGTTLTLTAPVWNASSVSTSYQWMRDAAGISGATRLVVQACGRRHRPHDHRSGDRHQDRLRARCVDQQRDHRRRAGPGRQHRRAHDHRCGGGPGDVARVHWLLAGDEWRQLRLPVVHRRGRGRQGDQEQLRRPDHRRRQVGERPGDRHGHRLGGRLGHQQLDTGREARVHHDGDAREEEDHPEGARGPDDQGGHGRLRRPAGADPDQGRLQGAHQGGAVVRQERHGGRPAQEVQEVRQAQADGDLSRQRGDRRVGRQGCHDSR